MDPSQEGRKAGASREGNDEERDDTAAPATYPFKVAVVCEVHDPDRDVHRLENRD